MFPVIGELNNLNSDPNYRVNTQILVGHLNACLLMGSKYNTVKKMILSQVTTTPSNSTITFQYGLKGQLRSESNITGKVQKDYIYLNNKPLAMVQHTTTNGTTTSAIYYIHNDHLGTPQAMSNQAGVLVWKASYGPFGKGTPNQDVDGDGNKVVFNIRFPGQYYDIESGLHYNYFRVYDPESGWYITSDPIGLRSGFNIYGYAAGNPIINVDPTGEAIALAVICFNPLGAVLCITTAVVVVNTARDTQRIISERGESNDPPTRANPGPTTPDPAITDPGGSGNSERAKKCRKFCSLKHLGTGKGSEDRFRECLRDCMKNPSICDQ